REGRGGTITRLDHGVWSYTRECFDCNEMMPWVKNDRNDILWNFAMSDHRNILYFLLGILTAAVIVLGYNFYQAKRQPNGVQINLGPNGLKIEGK
ncbi:MAG: hypothetical protein E7A86_11960, partial [Bradyrhizobium sp.]|nr:hypothetical protein [Bradyrhizobium sp.]